MVYQLFYLLYYGWSDLEEIGYNFHYEGATLENIEEILKEQAKIWIDKYVHGIGIETENLTEIENKTEFKSEVIKNFLELTEQTKIKSKIFSIWEKIKQMWTSPDAH